MTVREIALAITTVIFCAAAGGTESDQGNVLGDYELRILIPAKSKESCEAARQAIKKGWIQDVSPDTPTVCAPHPGFFSPASNCIQGFNCGTHGH